MSKIELENIKVRILQKREKKLLNSKNNSRNKNYKKKII